MIALLEATRTGSVTPEALMHALDSVTPYIRARVAGNQRGVQVTDVVSAVQDRLVKELHRFDPARGSLPAFAQHLACWVVPGELARPMREEPLGLRIAGVAATTGDPLTELVDVDDQYRWASYVTTHLSESDVALLTAIALGTSTHQARTDAGLTPRGYTNAIARIGAIARTVRAAMTAADTAEHVTFTVAAGCVADLHGSTTALGVLHAADTGNLRGKQCSDARNAAITALATSEQVCDRVARRSVQTACRLLRIAADVLTQEGVPA